MRAGPSARLGPLGDPQQFADALRQFADLMAWKGGPVNWDLAKNVARHAVVAEGDPSVLDSQRHQVDEALRLADLWLGDATAFPSGIRSTQAWSRSEWVEATLPVWSKLCDPIAAKAVETMGGMFALNPEELSEMPPEMRAAMSAMGGGLGGLAPMMQQIGGAMVGGQTGAAVGALAREVVSSTDIGLPLGPGGRRRAAARGRRRVRPRAFGGRGGGPAVPRAARGGPSPAVRARAVAAGQPARRGGGVRARHDGGHVACCARPCRRST